jgi:hypothetical protein
LKVGAELGKSNAVKPFHNEGGISSTHSVGKELDGLFVTGEETKEWTVMLIPDKHVITNVEGTLIVSNEESV